MKMSKLTDKSRRTKNSTTRQSETTEKIGREKWAMLLEGARATWVCFAHGSAFLQLKTPMTSLVYPNLPVFLLVLVLFLPPLSYSLHTQYQGIMIQL